MLLRNNFSGNLEEIKTFWYFEVTRAIWSEILNDTPYGNEAVSQDYSWLWGCEPYNNKLGLALTEVKKSSDATGGEIWISVGLNEWSGKKRLYFINLPWFKCVFSCVDWLTRRALAYNKFYFDGKQRNENIADWRFRPKMVSIMTIWASIAFFREKFRTVWLQLAHRLSKFQLVEGLVLLLNLAWS